MASTDWDQLYAIELAEWTKDWEAEMVRAALGRQLIADPVAYASGEYNKEFIRHERFYEDHEARILGWFKNHPPPEPIEARDALRQLIEDGVCISKHFVPRRPSPWIFTNKVYLWDYELASLHRPISRIAWCSRVSKPQRYGAPWPTSRFVIELPRAQLDKSAVITSFVRQGFKVVYCCLTNNAVVDAMGRLSSMEPLIKSQRFISKARHLQERLAEIGIIGFDVARYAASNPYSARAIDKPTTLRNLRSALDANGFYDLDHEALFEQEHEDYRSPELRGWESDVFFFTHTAFLARLTNTWKPWWVSLALAERSYSRAVEGDIGPRPRPIFIPKKKIVVVIDEPDEREFDTERIDADGKWWQRPPELQFSKGLNVGVPSFVGGEDPKLVVITARPKIVELVARSMLAVKYAVKVRKPKWLPTLKLWATEGQETGRGSTEAVPAVGDVGG